MDAEEILKIHANRFRKELEAKPLLMEIKHIFTPSTAQEIERIIDREGNIIAMDKILTILPMRTDWLKIFYKALSGKEINKPKLAELLKPFIDTDNSFGEEEKKEDYKEEKEEKEKIVYSLRTHLKDVPYLQVLKDFYPDDSPNWPYFITKYGFQPEVTLGDLMDYLYINNKQAYEQAKKEVKIAHAFIRQATTDAEITSLKSADKPVATDFTIKFPTSVSEAKNTNPREFTLKNMAPSSGFSQNAEQSYLSPLSEARYLQEKALNDITQNVTNENATISVPTNYMCQIPASVNNNSKVSLTLITTTDNKMDDIKNEFYKDRSNKMLVSDAESIEREMPDRNTKEEEFLEVDAGGEIPQATVNKIKVREAVNGKKDTSNSVISETEVLKTIIPKRDVLEANVRKMELPEANTDKKANIIEREFPEDNVLERKVLEDSVVKREVPEAENDKEKILKDNFSNMEVLETIDNTREVPEADIRNKEAEEADSIKYQALEAEDNKIEFASVNVGREPEKSLQGDANLPKDIHQEKSTQLLQLSVLTLAIVLGFCFGYYYRSR